MKKKIWIIALALFAIVVGMAVAQGTINTQAVALAGYSDGQRDYQSQNSLDSWSRNRAEVYANGYGNYEYKSQPWYLVYQVYLQAYQEGWRAKAAQVGGTVRW